MYRLGLTGRLARWTATRPWISIAAWVVLIGLAIVSAMGLGDVLTQEAELSVDTESEDADRLLDDAFGGTAEPMSVFVVSEGTSAVSSDPAVADLAADIGQLEGCRHRGRPPPGSGRTGQR